MYFAGLVLLMALAGSDETDAVAVAQKAFDGIAGHDAAMLKSVMLPDARIYSVRDAANPAGISGEDMATRIASTPGALLERFIGAPSVSIHGRIAQVWGEYEFLRDGKFSHCGVDSFSLLKTADGWKIATIVYTAETTGCKGH
jgi:hypothetical protein